nr:reverse transcriptase domain-containing protein [Tanacetum cinerariifolium]
MIKLILFPFSLIGAARRWLEKEPPHSITTWEDLVSKFINEFFPPSRTTNLRNEISNFQQRFDESFHEAWDRYKYILHACPHHGFTELHQLDTFYNALNPADQDSLNAAAGGNLLERSTQDVLTIIENKSKVRNSRSKPIASQVKACDVNSISLEIAKLTHAVNQQTNAVTTAMMAILKQFQANHLQLPLKLLRKLVLLVEVLICITSVLLPVATLSQNSGIISKDTFQQPQLITIRVIPVIVPQINTASTSGSRSLPSNTVANPKGKLKAITTRSDFVIDGPTVTTLSRSINLEEDEHVEESFTDPDLAEYTIKVPPPPAQKYKPSSQREFFVHQRDPRYPNIPYPSRMIKQKQQEKDEKMLKALLSNKEKLQELANTPLNENYSAVILKKLLKKLRDPGKFLIPCDFSELKYKALADLGASINLMPLSIWKKLGLPKLISTRMTLELANHAICTPDGIARDFFIPVGKFTFLADFDIVDYESDHRVPLILGRPFLHTARALIDVHGEEMILHDDKDSSLKDSINQKNRAHLADIFIDSIPEMFTDEHTLDYSSPLIFKVYADDFLEVESDAKNIYNDLFDSKGEKIKESKLLINELDLPCDFLPPSEYDLFISQDFSRVDALPSTNNEDKIFNPGILIQENPVEVINRVVQDKKLAISTASLVFEDFDPPFYESLFFKEVPKSKMLLPFLSKNKEIVFKPGIHTSEKFHSYFIPELSHQSYKVFKIT